MLTLDDLDMVTIPAGSCMMGSREDSDYALVPMEISREFQIMRCAVTQGLWRKVMDSEPWQECQDEYECMFFDALPFGDNLPAISLCREEAMLFAQKVGAAINAPVSLVPESLWEYAARGGQPDSDYYWGDDEEQAPAFEWGQWPSLTETLLQPGGQLKPNGFGLHDMVGSVNELVYDLIPEYGGYVIPAKHYSASVDYVSRDGAYALVKGGNCLDVQNGMRISAKSLREPDDRDVLIGCRLCIAPWLEL